MRRGGALLAALVVVAAAALAGVLYRPWWWGLYASESVRHTSSPPNGNGPPALMVVAHPDDELLFGGEMLLDPAFQWHVVVVTGASPNARFAWDRFNDVRFEEFRACAQALKFKGQMWDHEDSPMPWRTLDTERLHRQLARMLKEESWHRIITHNAEGEYGHAQHRAVHSAVRRAWEEAAAPVPALEVFDLDTDAPEDSKRKQDLCRALYPSQQRAFRRNEHWVRHGRTRLL